MAYPRAFVNSVVLPTGEILVVGGQTLPVPFSDDNAILIPELWNPTTQTFRQLAPMQTPRVYHSVALLMPDGRVFVGGGGQCGQGCPANHPDAEIFSPPYLFNPDGTAASRPAISSSPSSGSYGQAVTVKTNAKVSSFVLMRLPSVTHTVDNDQRRVPLQIHSSSGNSYVLSLPPDPGTAPPGPYMLFAINSNGVPSTGRMIGID